MFSTILSWSLGLTFLFSGVMKLPVLHAFGAAVQRTRLFPANMGRYVGWVLPFLELLLGSGLLLQWHLRTLAAAAILLALGFSIASMRAMGADTVVPCLCFGPLGDGNLGAGSLSHALFIGVQGAVLWWAAPEGSVSLPDSALGWLLLVLPAFVFMLLGLIVRLLPER